MKTMVNEIKVISFNEKKVERQITLNLVRKVAGGMEAAGDVYAPNGEKRVFTGIRTGTNIRSSLIIKVAAFMAATRLTSPSRRSSMHGRPLLTRLMPRRRPWL